MNKAVLIGGSHHNGLALVRNFGINGIKPYGILIGKKEYLKFICKSKYWEKIWVVNNESEALNILEKEFLDETEKPVLIPWSDGAAEMIDSNFDTLKEHFLLPSLNGVQGAICKMMDKKNQVLFAEKYNLPIAKTAIVDLDNIEIDSNIKAPFILKPVASYEGKKSDIKKCADTEEAITYMKELRNKGYNRILIQEFLDFDYEIALNGCCGKDVSYVVFKYLRCWRGSTSFFKTETNTNVRKVCDDIIKALLKEGYNGLFDVELFYKDNQVYLNEINWRNTGNCYIGSGVYFAVIWYLSMIGKDTSTYRHFCDDENQYCMNEATDLRHVVFGNLSLKEWNKDRKKVQSFALWYRDDIGPAIKQYTRLIKELLLHRRHG